MERPIGITILTFVAVFLAFLNAIVMLRFLGFLPFLGPIGVRIFNLWYALLYGLLAYIWVWLAQMLWQVDPAGLDVSGCYYDIQSVRGFCVAGYRRFMV